MKKLLILLAIVFLLFACDFDTSRVERIPVSGEIVQTEMYLDDFNEIFIAGPVDLVIKQDGGNGLQVNTYESIMDLFRVEVIHDVLFLYIEDTSKASKINIDFEIPGIDNMPLYSYMSGSKFKWPGNDKVLDVVLSVDDLVKISVYGESTIKTVGKYKGENLIVNVAGAVHLDAEFELKTLDVDLAGAGNLKLSGKAEYFEIDCAGAGNIKAYNFIADSVDLEIAGVCNAHVHAVESIVAEVAGMGTIKYMGNPSNISYEKAGIGSLKQVESVETEENEI
ncbi:MAG: DUF2807 domain-containing protein [Candidatus Marinimicrobia bacterium]|nr:DUF2807 domain-containing protein [Candidatus Neomarinimicrobiota bacterium]